MSSDSPRKKINWQSQSADGQVLLSMPWEVFVLCVAVLSIVNLVLAIVVREPDLDQVLVIIDFILVAIFAIDLLRRLRVADDNRAYLVHGYGWLDLISIFPALRIARILRIVKVTKILERMGGPEAAVRVFFKDKAAGGLLMVVFIAILVLEFGSLAILERRSERARRQHHHGAGRRLVRHRDDVDGGLRGLLPRHRPRPPLRQPHHRGRRRRLRHPHGLPRQRVPVAVGGLRRVGIGGHGRGAAGPSGRRGSLLTIETEQDGRSSP